MSLPPDELALDPADIVAAASKVLDAVVGEELRETAFAGAALATIMLHRGPSPDVQTDLALVEELSQWLAALPPDNPTGLIH